MLKSLFNMQSPCVLDAFQVSQPGRRQRHSWKAGGPGVMLREPPRCTWWGSRHRWDRKRWAAGDGMRDSVFVQGGSAPGTGPGGDPAPDRALLLFVQGLNIAPGREQAVPGCAWILHPFYSLGERLPTGLLPCSGGASHPCAPSPERAGPPAALLSRCYRKQRLVLSIGS